MALRERIPGWLWGLVLIAIARLLMMAVFPLVDTSEPRYAETARIMAETGDWITPWFEPGVPFWGKPPLAFWMSALSFRFLGYSDFAARFPAWLATLATLSLMYGFARSQFNIGVARLSVLIYASSLLPFLAAGAVLTDPYLTLAVTLSLVAFGKLSEAARPVWQYAFFVGLALGMLSKGPLAIILVLGVVLPWTLWHDRSREHVRRIAWMRGALLVLVLTAPWYVLAEIKTPGFLEYFIVGEHFYRFIDPGWQGDLYGSAHKRIYGSIWLDWLLATFPWGVVALWQLVRWGKAGGRMSEAFRRLSSPRITFLLLWAFATPLLFTFSGNILWTYVQPSLPAFAVLLAAGLLHRRASDDEWPRWRSLAIITPAAGVLLGCVAAVYPALVKTEKQLIEYYAAHAQPDQPLYYVDRRPFSARYYSHGQAKLYSGGSAAELLDRHPSGVYLAVSASQLSHLEGLVLSPVLFENRRYSLLFAKQKPGEQSPFFMSVR